MRRSVKRAQGKAVAGKQEFAVGAIPHHPCGFERIPRGKIESALHSYSYWPAGGKNSHVFSSAAVGGDLRKPTADTDGKLSPGFYILNRDLTSHPPADHHLEQLLKRPVFFAGSGCAKECLLQAANVRIIFCQAGQAGIKYHITCIFIEVLDHLHLGPSQSTLLVPFACNPGSICLPAGWPRLDTMK